MHWYNAPQGGGLLETGGSFVTNYISTDTVFYVEAGSVCPSPRIEAHVIINSTADPVVSDNSRCGNGTVVLTAISSARLLVQPCIRWIGIRNRTFIHHSITGSNRYFLRGSEFRLSKCTCHGYRDCQSCFVSSGRYRWLQLWSGHWFLQDWTDRCIGTMLQAVEIYCTQVQFSTHHS